MHFATQIFACWLEEAIILGDVLLPEGAMTFWDAKAADCAGHWIGPPLGWVNPVKEANAARTRMEIGVSDLEGECADQGSDYRDVLATRAAFVKNDRCAACRSRGRAGGAKGRERGRTTRKVAA